MTNKVGSNEHNPKVDAIPPKILMTAILYLMFENGLKISNGLPLKQGDSVQ